MTAVADLLFDSMISGLWPVLLLPILAARLCNDAALRLPAGSADWRIAGALAALPGVTLLVLVTAGMARSVAHLHPDDWAHFIQHHSIWIVAPILLAPATCKAVASRRSLAQLLRFAQTPAPRLAAVANRLGLHCLELPTSEPECFVAGMVRPTTYVSSGAILALGDRELEAALRHELAHVQGRDPAAFAVLGYLNDLVPGNGVAIGLYRQARERLADRRATSAGGALSLAAALVVFSRAQERTVPSMASAAGGPSRISALLDGTDVPAGRAALPFGLKAGLALLPWPAIQTGLAYTFCSS